MGLSINAINALIVNLHDLTRKIDLNVISFLYVCEIHSPSQRPEKPRVPQAQFAWCLHRDAPNHHEHHVRCTSASKERRTISPPHVIAVNRQIVKFIVHELRWDLALNHSCATASFSTTALTLQCSSFGL